MKINGIHLNYIHLKITPGRRAPKAKQGAEEPNLCPVCARLSRVCPGLPAPPSVFLPVPSLAMGSSVKRL